MNDLADSHANDIELPQKGYIKGFLDSNSILIKNVLFIVLGRY